MSPEYLAGFFDGEGCIDCQRMYPKTSEKFYVRPRIRVAQAVSGRIVLETLQQKFGGHLSMRKGSNANQQDSVSWEFLNKAGVLTLLKLMLPNLIIKREQALLVVWWLENATGRYSGRGIRPHLEEARMLFAEELSAMKRDPQRLSERAVAALTPLMR